MTKLEVILITLLKDNGIDKDSLIAITSMLRTAEQKADMVLYLAKNNNKLTIQQMLEQAVEIYKGSK